MKFNNSKLFLSAAVSTFAILAFSSCGGSKDNGSSGSCSSATGANAIPTSSTSTIPLYVGDPNTTGQYSYLNEPMVSVTVCTPNHTSASQCQTISNILIDTGSSGLRVFGSAIGSNVQLTQQTISANGTTLNLAECITFGTGADWGSVQKADVMLGNQTASNVPIQVININYASIPSSCASESPDTDPCTAGFNGILGVAPFVADCGARCAATSDSSNPGIYYGCDSSGCYNAAAGNCGTDSTCMFTVATASQISNPVASFASGYNNGLSFTLPSVGSNGASSVIGSVTLGIPASTPANVYQMDASGMTDGKFIDFTTIYNGTTYGGSSSSSTTAFIDSGSNLIYFPGGFSTCSGGSSAFCPSNTQNLTATIAGYSGTPTASTSFSVANADSLINNTNNSAFSNVGGTSTTSFDWGLPFFFGKTIYFGIESKTATLNSATKTGPYWAL